jgi:hypothetical protein
MGNDVDIDKTRENGGPRAEALIWTEQQNASSKIYPLPGEV